MPHRRAGRKPRPKRARTGRAIPDQRIIRDVLEAPPEIWALVVAFGNRQSTGRLCAVSRRFYSIFTPLLYGATAGHPVTDSKPAGLLIRTLSDAHTSALTPNPASLIETLSVPRYHRPIEAFAALRNLVKLSRGDQPMRGSALRALEWAFPAKAGELAIFLRAPGNFPHLKEISVKYGGEPACLELIQIPSLEKIGCGLELSPEIREHAPSTNVGVAQDEDEIRYDAWPRSWNVLGDALKSLPTSSPLLQALDLRVNMSPAWDTSPSWEGFGDLVNTINQIRFPALTSVKLAVNVRDCAHSEPAADFAPFLLAHTSLVSITLDVERTRIPTDVHGAQLSRLRSFTGSVQQCAAVSACTPELEELLFVFPFDPYRDTDDIANSPRFIPSLFPPNINRTVKHLNVRAVSKWNGLTYGCELSPHALPCLAMAFPNITHLDVYLNPQTNKPRDGFSGFLALEHLCIRERKNMAVSHRRKPAKTFFPRKKYAAQLSTALPSLPRLSDVEFALLVDRSVDPDSLGCPCCDEDWNEPWLPDSVVEYRFGVDRTGGEPELVLVGQSVL
ncbi:hypothetical protein FB451DRAFT_1283345 [Mycena latifolia]|nr:hypothetical protein FB451DRAFT_1283345 [Mycena latifolia]